MAWPCLSIRNRQMKLFQRNVVGRNVRPWKQSVESLEDSGVRWWVASLRSGVPWHRHRPPPPAAQRRKEPLRKKRVFVSTEWCTTRMWKERQSQTTTARWHRCRHRRAVVIAAMMMATVRLILMMMPMMRLPAAVVLTLVHQLATQVMNFWFSVSIFFRACCILNVQKRSIWHQYNIDGLPTDWPIDWQIFVPGRGFLEELLMAISQQLIIRFTFGLVLARSNWCRPISQCHLYSCPADPCWHGSKIWEKMGYNSACFPYVWLYALLAKQNWELYFTSQCNFIESFTETCSDAFIVRNSVWLLEPCFCVTAFYKPGSLFLHFCFL